jgi:hypothetical protein
MQDKREGQAVMTAEKIEILKKSEISTRMLTVLIVRAITSV